MTRAHLAFCHPGTVFFDRGAADEELPSFAALERPLPEDWELRREPQWTHLTPQETSLIRQGWKIHVSATLENCDRVLQVVMDYCFGHALPFKVLSGPDQLRRRNAKDGDRTASGKFVTIYPPDDATLERTLNELGDELEGEEGPYILSDLRWRSGPLYVRYGAFITEIVEGEHGRPIHCIRDPEGRLVEDRRGAVFRPPSWAPIPSFLDEALEARQRARLTGFNYKVHGAMHYSNGGGVYRGSHAETGEPVLLKEARPLAGLDDTGRDAVARQQTEVWALRQLDGLPSSGRLVEHLRGHEHQFLVREFVEGESLIQMATRTNPLVQGRRDPAEKAAYAHWVLGVLDAVDRGVRDMHGRGVVFGDLHPGNVLVRADGSVAFIDLETASPLDAAAPQVFAVPGYRAPLSYRGAQTDRFALGCMRLALLVPGATDRILWDTGSVEEAIRYVRAEFELPDEYAATVRADLGGLEQALPEAAAPPVPRFDESSWPRLTQEIARWILASATPEREDRLYPGDIAQFARPGAGLGLMHGAAGVLLALAEAGVTPPTEHLDWLLDRLSAGPAMVTGLHDGVTGIAYALERLGETERARELADETGNRPLDGLDQGLGSGLAGVGLGLTWFANRTGESGYLQRATDIADRMLATEPASATPPGLVYGGAGRALFLLALFDVTGDPQLLRAADTAVRADLAVYGHAVTGGPPPADVEEMRRAGFTPGTINGDGGVALAVNALVGRTEDAELAEVGTQIATRSANTWTPWSGLLRGRAGALLVAAAGADTEADLDWHVQGLRMNALTGPAGLAFFGDGNLRLSCDLGTGAAGVLAALDRVAAGGRREPAPLHLFGTA